LTSLYVDNEQYIFIDEANSDSSGQLNDLSPDLVERYTLALLEWEAVQDELSEIYKGK
jgi:hypothetical protein